jgi:signal transduction histidine kinase
MISRHQHLPFMGMSFAGLMLVCTVLRLQAQPQEITLTNIAQCRALSANEAARARPVLLQAVVIHKATPADRALVVADDSGCIYLLATNNTLSPFHQGDLVQINGVSDPGEFAPIVKVSKARRVGNAPLPEARRVSYQEIISGAMDAQWVEITGVIQRHYEEVPGSDISRFILSTGGGQLIVRMNAPQNPELKEDALVRVRALCFYQFTSKRQVLRPILQVIPGFPVIVEKPALEDPFSAPLRSAADLLLFSPDNALGHRAHVRGIVIHANADNTVWIRDDSSALRIQTRGGTPTRPGDEIDVVGFPKSGLATPELQDAIYRVLGHVDPPAPISITNAADAFEHEDDLIEIEGMLNSVERIVNGLILSLRSGDISFRVLLRIPEPTKSVPDWQPGSRVRVAGICSVTYDDTRPVMGIRRPQSFQLLLRSPDDLTVLETPSWWTVQHVTYLLSLASLLLVAAFGVFTLVARKRIREQQQQRAMAEAEFAAILSERNRVAREIHDTLAQGLAATSVQLSLASIQAKDAGGNLAKHIDAAQDLVRGSLLEARNTIWNMRSQVLEAGDLATALKSILTQMADGTELKTHFEVHGRIRRLAPVIENDVLRLGQEAITNATKHARARNIFVNLQFANGQFELRVRDDGVGFDVNKPHSNGGSFGLVGMRERAKNVSGDIRIKSAPNEGTELTFRVSMGGI